MGALLLKRKGGGHLGVPCHWTEIIHNGQEDCSVGLDQGMPQARHDSDRTVCVYGGGGVVLGSSWGPSISSYIWGSLSLRAFLNDCLKPSSTLMEPKLVSGAQGHFFF